MVNHQQRRRGNNPSPRRGTKKESRQKGRKDPSHHVRATGGDPNLGALQGGRNHGRGRVTGFFSWYLAKCID